MRFILVTTLALTPLLAKDNEPAKRLEEAAAVLSEVMFSWHFSGYDRKKHDAGRCNYTPLNLGEVPDYYRRFLDPIDIAVLKTCPMVNLKGKCVAERAKAIIALAHPDFREDLERRAYENRLIPRGVSFYCRESAFDDVQTKSTFVP